MFHPLELVLFSFSQPIPEQSWDFINRGKKWLDVDRPADCHHRHQRQMPPPPPSPGRKIRRQHVSVLLRNGTVTHMNEFCSLNRLVPTSNCPFEVPEQAASESRSHCRGATPKRTPPGCRTLCLTWEAIRGLRPGPWAVRQPDLPLPPTSLAGGGRCWGLTELPSGLREDAGERVGRRRAGPDCENHPEATWGVLEFWQHRALGPGGRICSL